MKQSVKVINADDKERIIVGCDKTACEGCKGSFFCQNKETSFEVINPERVDVKAGDDIEINLPGKKTVASVLISLGLPLIMFIPGYLIASAFTANPLWLLLSGAAGIVSGFLIAAVFFHFKGNDYVPTLIGKKDETL